MAAFKTLAKLEAEIAALGDLSRPELAERWLSTFKTPPPKGVRRPLMIRALAYQLQAKRWGGLRRDTVGRLRAIASGTAVEAPSAACEAKPSIGPGSRLYREWNGKTHVVEVGEDGLHWNGKTYRSLSAVARAITGARWSGPRFFGLTGVRSS